MKKTVSIAASVVLVLVIAVVAVVVVMNQSGSSHSKGTHTVATRGVRFVVPSGWTLVTLSAAQPCPPQQTNLVIVAEGGLGGDCKSADPTDATISATRVNPIEKAPATLTKVGKLDGWQQQEQYGSTKRWIAVVPGNDFQLTFYGPFDDATREMVIDSMVPA